MWKLSIALAFLAATPAKAQANTQTSTQTNAQMQVYNCFQNSGKLVTACQAFMFFKPEITQDFIVAFAAKDEPVIAASLNTGLINSAKILEVALSPAFSKKEKHAVLGSNKSYRAFLCKNKLLADHLVLEEYIEGLIAAIPYIYSERLEKNLKTVEAFLTAEDRQLFCQTRR